MCEKDTKKMEVEGPETKGEKAVPENEVKNEKRIVDEDRRCSHFRLGRFGKEF